MIGYEDDDVAVIARDERGLKEITKKLVVKAYMMGLRLNPAKCKVVRIGVSRG